MAKRFKVSLGMVKKLLSQQKKTGELEARHRYSGSKGRLLSEHGVKVNQLIARQPDVTLAEMKVRLPLDYTVGEIH